MKQNKHLKQHNLLSLDLLRPLKNLPRISKKWVKPARKKHKKSINLTMKLRQKNTKQIKM